MISSIKNGDVTLLPGIFFDREKINYNYLMSLDTKKLMQNYYYEAGIIVPEIQGFENIHLGWEAPNCQLRGHFLGHWLSAAAMTVAVKNDGILKAKINNIIEELDKCQKANGGKWVGPIPEKYFSKLEKNEYIWSPQYTIHKLIMGLTDAYKYAGNKKSLTILSNLADWFIKWTDKVLKSDNPGAIHGGEQGGMIEAWAELFELTGKQKYQTLAERYSDVSILKDLEEGKDALANVHQNASLPFIHGAAKLYEITGDSKYFRILENFWKHAVNEREMFCTGGQGSGEFWIDKGKTGSHIGERTQEFCTVYNMIRVADYLFKFTGNAIYLDYIERNLYNGVLAQQNKETGMPDYFLSLKSGSKKEWGSPTKDFWCCHGTMIQANTIFPSLCYYKSDDEKRIFISQYIPSTANFSFGENKEDKIEISQNLNMKYYNAPTHFDISDNGHTSRWMLKFEVKAHSEFTLSFRIPNWIAGKPTVIVNGTEIDVPSNCDKCGFLNIKKNWTDSEISMYLPTELSEHTLSDAKDKCAIMEGPIVLAGLSDNDYSLRFPKKQDGTKVKLSYIMKKITEHTYATFPWRQSTYRTSLQDRETTFVPLYEITDETYTVYWTKK